MGDDSDESKRTLYCGNLNEKVTEEILYELFLQAGPLEKVKLVQGKPFAFITFQHEVSVPYTIELMDGIKLFGKTLKLQFRSRPEASPEPLFQRSFSAPTFHGDQNQYRSSTMEPPPPHRRFDSGPDGSPYSDSPYSSPSHSDNDTHRGRHWRNDRHRSSAQQDNPAAYRQQAAQLQQNIQAQLAQARAMQDAMRQMPPSLMGQPPHIHLNPWQQPHYSHNRRRY